MRLKLSVLSLGLAALCACQKGPSAPDVTPEPPAVAEPAAPVASPPAAPDGVVPHPENTLYAASRMTDTVDPSVLKTDPMAVLFAREPGWDDPAVVTRWMNVNPAVYGYLPVEVQRQSDVHAAAVALGLPVGVLVTADVVALSAPQANSPIALHASDTTNGYLVEGRPEQAFAAGATAPRLAAQDVDGVQWIQVTEAVTRTAAEDDALFEMLSNVGGVDRADFSTSSDPGWIPASVTEPVVLASQCEAGLRTFQSVENGDLAVYVQFREFTTEDFSDAAYTLLEHAESGALVPGAQIYVVVCDGSIVWLPF